MSYIDKVEMTTMTACTNRLVAEGFTENFTATETGLQAPSTEQVYTPAEVRITSFYRFEGESDPADSAIVYAVETNDGLKGLLIDAYGGPYVSRKVSRFIAEVDEIKKRETGHEQA